MSASFNNRRVISKVVQPDAISNLPDHLVEKILIRLPLQEAARTSILSRQWRYKWVKLSQLVFDAGFCKPPSRYKVLMRIFQVLLVHDGPITKFVVSVPGLESRNEIDQILCSLSGKGVEEFTLHVFRGKHYQLHSSLFSFTKLTHMNLQNCAFKPPLSFQGFSELSYMNLCNCVFKLPPSFQGFSKLVQLILHEVISDDETLVTLIAQASMLKYLTIASSSTLNLNIVAPNLKCLQFMAHSNLVQCFNAPLLVNASFLLKVPRNAEEEEEATDLRILLNSAPFIQNLKLNYYYLKSLVAGGVSPDLKLNYLKVLKLSAIHFARRNEVTCALLLITSCSNLQNLTLEAFQEVGLTIQDKQCFMELGNKDLSICKVREVEMLNISGLWPELEFIKLVLGKLLMLERMIVEPHPKIRSARRFNILKELAQYRRASPGVVITHRDQRSGLCMII